MTNQFVCKCAFQRILQFFLLFFVYKMEVWKQQFPQISFLLQIQRKIGWGGFYRKKLTTYYEKQSNPNYDCHPCSFKTKVIVNRWSLPKYHFWNKKLKFKLRTLNESCCRQVVVTCSGLTSDFLLSLKCFIVFISILFDLSNSLVSSKKSFF